MLSSPSQNDIFFFRLAECIKKTQTQVKANQYVLNLAYYIECIKHIDKKDLPCTTTGL